MSYSTATLPLTTIFTPPASCSSHWTYEASYYNSISGGLLLQNAEKENLDVACFPSGFAGYGRAPSFIQVYSPGACPSGYTTPAVFYNSGTTTAVCCQKGFSYSSTFSSIDFFGSNSVSFEGCISTYSNSNAATTVPARANNTDLLTTSVTGPVTMWGQPIVVQYQQQDLSLFATSTSTTSSSTANASTTQPTATSTAFVSSTPKPDDGLSTGAKAGIGVGVAAVVLLFLAAAILLFRRKRSATTKELGEAWERKEIGGEEIRPNGETKAPAREMVELE